MLDGISVWLVSHQRRRCGNERGVLHDVRGDTVSTELKLYWGIARRILALRLVGPRAGSSAVPVNKAHIFDVLGLSPIDLILRRRNRRRVTDLKEVNERTGAGGGRTEEMIVGSD